jgi:hypothetical protein
MERLPFLPALLALAPLDLLLTALQGGNATTTFDAPVPGGDILNSGTVSTCPY